MLVDKESRQPARGDQASHDRGCRLSAGTGSMAGLSGALGHPGRLHRHPGQLHDPVPEPALGAERLVVPAIRPGPDRDLDEHSVVYHDAWIRRPHAPGYTRSSSWRLLFGLLLAFAIGTVWWQGKFFLYHWIITMPFLAALVGLSAARNDRSDTGALGHSPDRRDRGRAVRRGDPAVELTTSDVRRLFLSLSAHVW